jgi:DNA-binding transcriptional ArsR family regulator
MGADTGTRIQSLPDTIAGDVDIAAVAALLAEPTRVRIMMALDDGRALPATVLASEAGIAASTASSHLSKLLDGGLLAVEQHGRHRYYRFSGPQVGDLMEMLSAMAPQHPVRSLREGTAARQLRFARTCYDHLAGELGVALMHSMLRSGILAGGDGFRVNGDRLSAAGNIVDYHLTETGHHRLTEFGIDFEHLPARRPLIRYCVDWSEQNHHLSGALGAALTDRMFALGWIHRSPHARSVLISGAGYQGLQQEFGVVLAGSERAPGTARAEIDRARTPLSRRQVAGGRAA